MNKMLPVYLLKKQLPLILAFFLPTLLFGQMTFTSTVPPSTTPLEVCNIPRSFTVTVTNSSASIASGNQLTITLPEGISYVSGSISGTAVFESNISNLEAPVFSIGAIDPGTSRVITYQARAYCERINESVNINQFSLTNNLGTFTDVTASYNVSYAALTITSVTNNNYSGSSGSSFSRIISVTNGGFGRVQEIKVDEFNDGGPAGFLITSVSAGVASSATLPANSTTFTITDFTGIGNGDAFFDNGETISFTENITTTSACSFTAITTDYIAYYGCFNRCPVTNSTDIAGYYTAHANLDGTNYTTSWQLNATTPNPFPVCPGDVLHESFTLTNNGNGGAATNVRMLLQSNQADRQYITNVRVNGVPVTTTILAPTTLGCFSSVPSDAGHQVEAIIPSISAGQTINVTFDLQRCSNASYCNPVARTNPQNYLVQLIFTDACGNTNQSFVADKLGYSGPSAINSGDVEQSGSGADYPIYLKDTETKGFCYTYNFQPPAFNNANAYLEWVIPLPAGLTFLPGNHAALTASYGTENIPVAPGYPLLISGGATDSLIVRFTTASFYGNVAGWPGWGKYELCVDLTGIAGVDCATAYVITPFMRFAPSGSCNSFYYKFFCDDNIKQSWYTQRTCTSICEGANNVFFETGRITYGLPDNNNDNIYDGSGTVDISKINLKNVVPGDTIVGIYKAVVSNPNGVTNWNYGGVGILAGGNAKTYSDPKFFNANVKIWDASAAAYLTLGCSSIVPQDSAYGVDVQVYYNFSSCLPSGFAFDEGDSILLDFSFQHRLNSTYSRVLSVSPCAFVSSIAHPYYDYWANPVSQKGCGYTPDYYRHHEAWNFLHTSLAQNPEGCNLGQFDFALQGGYYNSTNCNVKESFPYEIRRSGLFKKLTVALPPNAVFDYATYRSANPDCSSTAGNPLIPLTVSPGSVVFDISQVYAVNGGTLDHIGERNEVMGSIFFRDACDNGTYNLPAILNVELEAPLKNVLPPTTTASATYSVTVTSGNEISLQANNGNTYQSVSDTAEWLVTVATPNSTGSLPNAWLAKKPGISGVNIVSVTPVFCGGSLPNGSPDIMPNANGVYELGATNPLAAKCYKIKATFSNCVKDSIVFMGGYDCNAYPASVSNPALLCNYDEIAFYAQSAPTIQLQQLITTDAGSSIHDLCDTLNYNLSVTSAQTGVIKNVKTSYVMTPTNAVQVVAGSSEIEYPHGSGNWLPLPDPTLIGSTYNWNISAAPSVAASIGANGLPGVTSAPNNRFNLRFKAVTLPCNFKSDATFLFTTEGTKPCGTKIYATDQITEPVKIAGAPTPYNTYTVRLDNTDASMCNNQTAVVRFSAINRGPFVSSATEFIDFIVYTGASVTGALTPVHNAPTGIPSVISAPGGTIYRVAMPAGVVINDSIVFTLPVRINDNISCDTNRVRIEANTNISFSATCVSTGTVCTIGQITGQDNNNFIHIERTSLELSNLTAYTTLNPPSGEVLHASVWVKNTGANAVTAGAPITVQFYHDANLNGQVNVGESLLGAQIQTVNINQGDSVLVNFTQVIPAGSACPLLATIAKTACICTVPVAATTTVPVEPDSINITICSGVTTAPIGSAAITGYSYTWTAITPGALAYLSDPTIANPTFNKPTSIGTAENIVYQLYIDRGAGCAAVQTVTVTVDDPANCANGSIGDYVWVDVNANGLQDDGLASGINGVTVQLWDPLDGIIGNGNDVLITSTTTANDGSGNPGYYEFNNLATGDYYMQFPVTYNGAALTTPNTNIGVDGNSDANPATGASGIIHINTGSSSYEKNNGTIDAGYLAQIILGDKVWLDNDGDGIQDAGESGMSGVTVTLYNSTHDAVATTVTNALGLYQFAGIAPGLYYIGVTPPPTYTFTQSTGTDVNNAVNSDVNVSGFTTAITVHAGQTELDVDAGLVKLTLLATNNITSSATLQGITAIVNWRVNIENSISYYELQRSTDNSKYDVVGNVAAIGNANLPVNYQFNDNIASIDGGTVVYYRIKSVTKDGWITYSNVTFVRVPKTTNLSIFPNPVKSRLSINVSSLTSGLAEIRIMDIKGKLMYRSNYKVAKGNNQFAVEGMNKYPKGTYMLEVINNNEKKIIRLIKD